MQEWNQIEREFWDKIVYFGYFPRLSVIYPRLERYKLTASTIGKSSIQDEGDNEPCLAMIEPLI